MKKILYTLLCLSFLASSLSGLIHAPQAKAAFNANNIIDDAVFGDYSSMSAGSIDNFLNSFPNSCISTNNGFLANNPFGYSPSGGYIYGGNVSAGTVIASASNAYGISPKVLLTTLQKEQSLVTGNGGCDNLGYAASMGYGCPDSGGGYNYSGLDPAMFTLNGNANRNVNGTCVNRSTAAGFPQQVIRAAWLLQFGRHRSEGDTSWAVVKGAWNNSDDPQTCYGGPMTQGTLKRCSNSTATFYDGYTTIDGSATHMDNGATAALYWYTPHFHGNQNFVSIYESWFGSTHAANYSWQMAGQYAYTDSSKSTEVALTNMHPGDRVYLQFTATNIGNQSWSNTGSNPVRVGAEDPNGNPDYSSPFCDATWISCARPATMDEAVINPGDTGTFSFWYKVPSGAGGNYLSRFSLLAEGKTWMNDPGMSFYTTVIPDIYSWQFMGQDAFTDNNRTTEVGLTNMHPGDRVYLQFTAKNTGNKNWVNSGANPIHVGTWHDADRPSNFCDNTWLSCTRPATMDESIIHPGETGTFGFWYVAPNVPSQSTYVEQFNLLIEGVTWMNPTGMSFYTVVKPNTYTWQMVGQDAFSDSSKATEVGLTHLHPGDRVYLQFKAKNTGNLTWSNTGSTPIHVGTWSDADRPSNFCDNTWITCARPASMIESSVAPGQVGTFEFWYKAPAVTKTSTYVEQFNLIKENDRWLSPTGMSFYTVVQPN